MRFSSSSVHRLDGVAGFWYRSESQRSRLDANGGTDLPVRARRQGAKASFFHNPVSRLPAEGVAQVRGASGLKVGAPTSRDLIKEKKSLTGIKHTWFLLNSKRCQDDNQE